MVPQKQISKGRRRDKAVDTISSCSHLCMLGSTPVDVVCSLTELLLLSSQS
jgi:hypothetical protein